MRSMLARLAMVAMLLCSLAVESATAPAVSAARPGVLTARPSSIDFHKQPVGSENYRRAKITNTSGSAVDLLVDGGLPDDFGFGLMPGSTCPVLARETFAPGESCYIVVRYSPTEFFAGRLQKGTLQATAADPTTGVVYSTLEIEVTGTGSL
jgi:hypothetical protein